MSSSAHYFSSAPAGHDGLRPISVRAAGVSLHLMSGAGTFSRDGLDVGSRLLLETFLPRASADAQTWLDLGCGWGAVGCVLAHARPDCRIIACDINRRAARLAQKNARDNNLKTEVWCGDGAAALRDETCDAILCNPPVRAGNAVIAQLFDDSFRVLRPGGSLWIVLRTAQGAKSWQRRLEAQFGNCELRAQGKGFRIFQSVK